MEIKHGQLLEIIPLVSKTWKVSFTLIPYGEPVSEWRSLFHMTTGENRLSYGSRICSINIVPGEMFVDVTTNINGDTEYHGYGYLLCEGSSKTSVTKNEENHLEMSQTVDNSTGKYYISFSLNGKECGNVVNEDPTEFSNVKVYAANPWLGNIEGYIRNYKFQNID